jgi:hypothetical protein
MADTPQPPALSFGSSPLLAILERFATDPAFDRETFRMVLQAHRDMVEDQKKSAYIVAMNAAQAEIQQVKASGKNPVFSSAYPLLKDLDDGCRAHYSDKGLSCTFGSILTKTYDPPVPPPREQDMRVVLRISHVDGYYEEIHVDPPKDLAPGGPRSATAIQNLGKNITYARRYLLQMAFNLVPFVNPDDNDGNDVRTVTAKQAAEMVAKAADAGVDLGALLSGMSKGQVVAAEDVPEAEYAQVMNVLIQRAKRRVAQDQPKEEKTDG